MTVETGDLVDRLGWPVITTRGYPPDSPSDFTRENVHLSGNSLGDPHGCSTRVTRLEQLPLLSSYLHPLPTHNSTGSTTFGRPGLGLLAPHSQRGNRAVPSPLPTSHQVETHHSNQPQDPKPSLNNALIKSKRQFVTGTSRVVTHRSTRPAQSSLIAEV